MANLERLNEIGYKQWDGSIGVILDPFSVMRTLDYKRVHRMATAKWLIALFDFIGWPVAILGFIVNMDNVKSAIIAILAISFLAVRLYFYIIKNKQAVREKDLELWHKEQDKQDRINKKSPH